MKKLLILLLLLAPAGVSARITSIITFPSGEQGEIQFNDNGLFGSSNTFTFSTTTGRMTVSSMSATSVVFSTAHLVSQINWADGTVQVSSPSAGSGSGTGKERVVQDDGTEIDADVSTFNFTGGIGATQTASGNVGVFLRFDPSTFTVVGDSLTLVEKYLTESSATATYLTQSSAVATYLQTETGDIESITAGSGLSGGASSGTAVLTLVSTSSFYVQNQSASQQSANFWVGPSTASMIFASSVTAQDSVGGNSNNINNRRVILRHTGSSGNNNAVSIVGRLKNSSGDDEDFATIEFESDNATAGGEDGAINFYLQDNSASVRPMYMTAATRNILFDDAYPIQFDGTTNDGTLTFSDASDRLTVGGMEFYLDSQSPLNAQSTITGTTATFTSSMTLTFLPSENCLGTNADGDIISGTCPGGGGTTDPLDITSGTVDDYFRVPAYSSNTLTTLGEVNVDSTTLTNQGSFNFHDGTQTLYVMGTTNTASGLSQGIPVCRSGTCRWEEGVIIATQSFSVTITSGTGWDNLTIPIWQAPDDTSVTISKVRATIMGGTSITYNLDERAYGSLASVGTDVYSSSQTADTNGEIETSFSNAGLAAASHLVFKTDTSAASGTPSLIQITVYYEED